MQLLSAPIHPPGCCCVCRTTPKGPYLDLGQFVDRERLYLCPACISEAKRVLGVTDATSYDEPDATLEMADANRKADEALDAAMDKLEAADAALEAARGDGKSDETDGVSCPVCGKVCANEFGLRGHMRSHDKDDDA